ncbi:MAG: Uma2 family endonuclease [Leptothrix sp. (in: b-proteobacteria)]
MPSHQPAMTAAEYLAWETAQPERHEFLDGEIWAMAGAEDRHVTLAGNIYMALRQHLHGSSCRTFMSDMKLHAESANSYFYPDVFVTCSETDRASTLVKREPTLVVEVLSNSTAAYDRGAKFAHYRQIPTLREIALIDPDTRRADVYRRGADGLWVLHPFDPGQGIAFASVDLRIANDVLYADID